MSGFTLHGATLFDARRACTRPGTTVVVKEGRIAWVGPDDACPEEHAFAGRRISADGGLVTPGLIDCHTHLVFGGDRSAEFGERLRGASYQEILTRGGGIMSTVRATREASDEELLDGLQARRERMAELGVTTIEVKSGYGLEHATEFRMLETIARAAETPGPRLVPTYLGAHVVPPGIDRAGYVRSLVEEDIPEVGRRGIATACDVFCEGGAFTLAEAEQILRAGRRAGLHARIHAEQLSNLGGAAMAAGLGATSADHLEFLDEVGAAAMGAAGTVAVLLPWAQVTLGAQNPPIAALRRHNVPMALATDCNPGTSMTTNLHLVMQLGCVLYRLSPEEVLQAVTWNAARAMGLGESLGLVEPGFAADLCLWGCEHPVDLVYEAGGMLPLLATVQAGEFVS